MSNSKNAPSQLVASDAIESQIDPFIAGLKAAGYATGTLISDWAARELWPVGVGDVGDEPVRMLGWRLNVCAGLAV